MFRKRKVPRVFLEVSFSKVPEGSKRCLKGSRLLRQCLAGSR